MRDPHNDCAGLETKNEPDQDNIFFRLQRLFVSVKNSKAVHCNLQSSSF